MQYCNLNWTSQKLYVEVITMAHKKHPKLYNPKLELSFK